MENTTEAPLKARENKARRAAIRQGYVLRKSKVRDPHALTFGTYMITDENNNVVYEGNNTADRGYGLTLEDVEKWLAR